MVRSVIVIATLLAFASPQALAKHGLKVAKDSGKAATDGVAKQTDQAVHCTDKAVKNGVKAGAGCSTKDATKDATSSATKDAKVTGKMTLKVAKKTRRLEMPQAPKQTRLLENDGGARQFAEDEAALLAVTEAVADLANVPMDRVDVTMEPGTNGTVQVTYQVRVPANASRSAGHIKKTLLGHEINHLSSKMMEKVKANAGSSYDVSVTQHQADVAGECHVATDQTYAECYHSVMWAMTTGIKKTPKFYKDFPLSVNSSFADFQCALHRQVGAADAGAGHNCPMPCGVCDEIKQSLPSSGSTGTPPSTGLSITIILSVLAVVIVGVGLVIAWIYCRRAPKRPKRTKRGLVSNSRALAMSSTAEAKPLTQPVPQPPTQVTAQPISVQYVQAPYVQAPQSKLLPLPVQYAQARVTVPMAASTTAAMPAYYVVQS